MIFLLTLRGSGAIEDTDRPFIALVLLEAPTPCVNCGETMPAASRAVFHDRKGVAHPRSKCRAMLPPPRRTV